MSLYNALVTQDVTVKLQLRGNVLHLQIHYFSARFSQQAIQPVNEPKSQFGHQSRYNIISRKLNFGKKRKDKLVCPTWHRTHLLPAKLSGRQKRGIHNIHTI